MSINLIETKEINIAQLVILYFSVNFLTCAKSL